MDLNKEKKNLMGAGAMVCLMLVLFIGMKFINEVKASRFVGAGLPVNNFITVTGEGKINASPDIATINFAVESSKITQLESSNEVNVKTKNILDALKNNGIEEKDIKTEGYNSYPKYSNNSCNYYGGICASESKIVGYTVSQNITVKIRKVDDVNTIVDDINKIGVMNMSGPNFTFDDPAKIQDEARAKAIENAKEKAKILANQLGVKIIRITSFQENGGNYPMPMYAEMKSDMALGASNITSEIPKGENTLSSNVTITYEIK